MEIPDVHLMSKIEWQIFGTLTFKKERMPDHHRQKMWFAQMRTLAKWQHVHFSKLLWVLRTEQGEKTGRTHFHCLIGGLPKTALRDATLVKHQRGGHSWQNRTTHALHSKWARMGLNEKDTNLRISRWSIYQAHLNGASYIVKCLDGMESRDLADKYEAGKFVWGNNELTLSDSVFKVVSAYLRTSPDREVIQREPEASRRRSSHEENPYWVV